MRLRVGEMDSLFGTFVTFLEGHPCVSDVRLEMVSDRNGQSTKEMDAWEEKNHPLKLPSDLKDFYQSNDGLYLRYNSILRNRSVPFGCIHINKLPDLDRLTNVTAQGSAHAIAHHGSKESKESKEKQGGNAQGSSESKEKQGSSAQGSSAQGSSVQGNVQGSKENIYFCLDKKAHTVHGGSVALRYSPNRAGTNRAGTNRAGTTSQDDGSNTDGSWSVWFLDISGRWNFVAASFSEYYSLLLCHLGVPRWLYAFTAQGLDPSAKSWLAFLGPERLAIDLERSHQTVLKARQAKQAKKTYKITN